MDILKINHKNVKLVTVNVRLVWILLIYVLYVQKVINRILPLTVLNVTLDVEIVVLNLMNVLLV